MPPLHTNPPIYGRLCFRGRQEEKFGETSGASGGAILRWYAFLVASDQIYEGLGSERGEEPGPCTPSCRPTGRVSTHAVGGYNGDEGPVSEEP